MKIESNNMKHIFTIITVFFVASCIYAQDEIKEKEKALDISKNLTWDANKALSEEKFTAAEVDYRKAIAKSQENVAAPYNLGNAYYNNETYSEAFARYKEAGAKENVDKKEKHQAFHNMGNVFMKMKQYEPAVEAYKEALRNNPKDDETRYNLALAKEMLKKEQEEQKNDNKEDKENKDQDKKENQDKDKNEGDKGDKKEDGEKGDKGDEKKEDKDEGEGNEKEEKKKKPEEGDQEKKPQQPRPNQLSKQQVQNLLEAMQNEEKKVQQKIDKKKAKGVKVKNQKDW